MIIEPRIGWAGRELKDKSAIDWLGGKVIEPWDGWVGRVLKDHTTME